MEWFSKNWTVLTGIVAAFVASLTLAFKIGQKNNGIDRAVETLEQDVTNLKKNQLTFFKSIPRTVIEGKDTLATMGDCERQRNACSVHVITGELSDTMHIVKQAVSLLIIHNKDIPQEDRDRVIKELVK